MPQELNPLSLQQPSLIYKTLFNAAWATLQQFGNNTELQLGTIAILHTWGQNLSLHPHIHCVVPGGGIGKDGKWQKQLRSNKYLFPVKALGKVFRAKYVQQLRANGVADQQLHHNLFCKNWVVYAKKPFGGSKQVMEYLGQYTHKVAISNHRIGNVTENEVSFNYKDYRDEGKTKTMTLEH